MNTAFFFQTQQIPDSSSILDELKKREFFFSYFQVDQKYYLFFYGQKSIDINFLYQSVQVIQELDSKKRQIRSLRGFFLYALEIIERGKDFEILSTNLKPFFGICPATVKNIIRQNKKSYLDHKTIEASVTTLWQRQLQIQEKNSRLWKIKFKFFRIN